MKRRLLFVSFLLAYGLLIMPFTGFLANRPVEVKLGYLPHPQVLKILAADHGPLLAEMSVVKVLFYFGTLVEKFHENVIIRPEHANMYRTLRTATQLDPYNMDAYYFAQAAFTWGLNRVAEVNELLEHGVKYRTWDPWMHFYLGFNYAYFLKDYANAAKYLKRAGELPPYNPLFTKLAARYYYESDQTEAGLAYLEAMIENAKDRVVKQTYQHRYDALKAIMILEKALSGYVNIKKHKPESLNELIQEGLLQSIPEDPYGGTFYLDADGRVRSTSKLAAPNL